MRKSTLILSLLLTAGVLSLLVVLVSTYKRTLETAVPAQATQVQEQPQAQQTAQSTPGLPEAAAVEPIRIYDAAAIAANVLGHRDVYITEYVQFNGTDVYLVTFLSGDLVYVSLDGQVVSASKQAGINPYQPLSHSK